LFCGVTPMGDLGCWKNPIVNQCDLSLCGSKEQLRFM